MRRPKLPVTVDTLALPEAAPDAVILLAMTTPFAVLATTLPLKVVAIIVLLAILT